MEIEQLTDACYQAATTTKATEPRRKRPRPYTKHGLVTLKQAVRGLGGRVIDRRTKLGKSLAHWRTDLIRDIGGPEVVSTQQVAVEDLAVRSKLMRDDAEFLSPYGIRSISKFHEQHPYVFHVHG